MTHEKLVQYRFDLASDIMSVGYTSRGKLEYFDSLTNEELWRSTREAIAYDTTTASFDLGTVDPYEMRTKFGKSLVYLVETATDMSLERSNTESRNIACGLAEPGFMKSLRPHTHKQNAPILIESNGGISAMMKFNVGSENTILSLGNNDELIEGGLYGLPSEIEDYVRDARPAGGPVIVAANDFYNITGDVNPIRQTSFMIDDEARADFAEVLQKGPNGILGMHDMQLWADKVATSDEQASRKRGARLLEVLNDYIS